MAEVLFPHLQDLIIQNLTCHPDHIRVDVQSKQPDSPCPACGVLSSHIHSHYQRLLKGLPVAGRKFSFSLLVRRFRCREGLCSRKIFCERLLDVAHPYARWTLQAQRLIQDVACQHGGEVGALMLCRMFLPVSPTTLLRRIRQTTLPEQKEPKVIGIDDFAFRKGQTYGTVITDLEAGRIIEVLPDRTSSTLETWLKAHPGVEVISRDRATEYRKACIDGAPQAQQVLDRWHILKNFRDAVERYLKRSSSDLMRAAQQIGMSVQPRIYAATQTRVSEQAKKKVEVLHQAIQALGAQGLTILAISKELKVTRATVRKYLGSPVPPVRTRNKRRKCLLDPYEAHLVKRWNEGCQNAYALWREIRAMGFAGKSQTISKWATRRRTGPTPLTAVKFSDSRQYGSIPPTLLESSAFQRRGLNPSQVVWCLLLPEKRLSEKEKSLRAALKDHLPAAEQLCDLAGQFFAVFREKNTVLLESWLHRASECSVREVQSFAAGLNLELFEVKAAVESPWSNGLTEGKVTKIKALKRQMFGRCGFDMLRRRVLFAG